MLKEGDNAPEGIELMDQDGNLVKIDDLKGARTIFYTYPEDLENMSLSMSLQKQKFSIPFFS